MGTPLPPPQKGGGALQIFGHVYCNQMAGWMKLVLGMEVGLSPGDFVLDGDTALPKKGTEHPPQFSANLYCAKTAGCITMPLGMEVGLSPGDFVFDGDPAPSAKRGQSPLPNFRLMPIVAKRLDGSRWRLAWRWVLVQATLC